MFLKDFLYICLSWLAALEHGQIEENSVNSGVFKGLGRQGNWKHCKKWCFGTVLWRQMCKLPCFEGKHCKNMQTHFKKHGIWRILWKKMQIAVQNVVWAVFLGVVVVAIAGEKMKKHPLGGSQGGGEEIVALDGPGCGCGCEAFFEIEMQITCTNVPKKTVMSVNYLAPVTDQKRTCGVGGHPTRSGVNYIERYKRTWKAVGIKCERLLRV